MSEEKTYNAHCFCGDVKLVLTGEPVVMGYCHCNDCRHWSAGPVNAFTLWKPDTVKVVEGEDKMQTYNKTPGSSRKWCGRCGGHVLTDHPEMGLVDVYSVIIENFSFTPSMHVFYKESVLPIKDGMPKFKDLPEQAGGSGETLPE